MNDNDPAVVEYLLKNSDFFSRNAGIIELMDIPDRNDGAVSLVHHQMRKLREKSNDSDRSIEMILGTARRNDHISRALHRLAVELQLAESIDDIFASLRSEIIEPLQIEHYTAWVITDSAADASDAGWLRYIDSKRIELEVVRKTLGAAPVVLGLAKDSIRQALFPLLDTSIRSLALVALVSGKRLGYLAFASEKQERYDPTQSTDFLEQLGELIGAAIRRIKNQ